jgi:predicted deacylase
MNRIVSTPAAVDFNSPGRRDYLVRFEHPTLWGDYLIPMTVIIGREQRNARGVVAIGGTHGNEYEGPVAIKNLLQEIPVDRVRGRIILIPTLNVPAFNAGVRDTPDDGVNLNRAFPGNECGSITHRIAHFIAAHIFPQVHVVLDIHAGAHVARFVPLTAFHHVPDLEQRRAMERTARAFGSRFTMIYQSGTAGLLTGMAERLGKITVGTESGWGCAVNREGTSMARQGILTACVMHEQLDMPSPKQEHHQGSEQVLTDNSELSCYINARFDGHFEPTVDCGARVSIGQTIGRLHDFNRIDEPASAITAPHDGFVICQAWNARVFRGQVVSVVSIPQPWMAQLQFIN